MLFKNELKQIQVQECPVKTEEDSHNSSYVATAHTVDLPRSGKVLVVDIFRAVTKTLALRFFSDGKLFQMLRFFSFGAPCQEPAWMQSKTERYIGYDHITTTKKDLSLMQLMLKNGLSTWRTHYGYDYADDLIDDFIEQINQNKYGRVRETREVLQKAHFEMYPAFPEGLPDFCERVIFNNRTYIFISKKHEARRCKHGTIGGYRDVVCGHCGKKYRIEQNVRPGQHGQCVKCGAHGTYRGNWPQVSNFTDKGKICIAHRVDGQLILRWAEVFREFKGGKANYQFVDYCYNLHLLVKNRPILYAYKYQPVMGWGYDWTRKRNGDANYEKTFVYTDNLTEVFGQKYYNVDLRAGV